MSYHYCQKKQKPKTGPWCHARVKIISISPIVHIPSDTQQGIFVGICGIKGEALSGYTNFNFSPDQLWTHNSLGLFLTQAQSSIQFVLLFLFSPTFSSSHRKGNMLYLKRNVHPRGQRLLQNDPTLFPCWKPLYVLLRSTVRKRQITMLRASVIWGHPTYKIKMAKFTYE